MTLACALDWAHKSVAIILVPSYIGLLKAYIKRLFTRIRKYRSCLVQHHLSIDDGDRFSLKGCVRGKVILCL